MGLGSYLKLDFSRHYHFSIDIMEVILDVVDNTTLWSKS